MSLWIPEHICFVKKFLCNKKKTRRAQLAIMHALLKLNSAFLVFLQARQLKRLQSDNAALRAQVQQLKGENARLQGEGVTMRAADKEMRRQLEEARAQLECPVCMDGRPDMLLACGHMVCGGCNKKLRTCPSCRQPHDARRSRKVYWG